MNYINLVSLALTAAFLGCGSSSAKSEMKNSIIKLPDPSLKGSVSVEEAINKRRSRRSFEKTPLAMEQLSQILWCAQGITNKKGERRASPSAGATYPMTIYVVIGDKTCGNITAGVYEYLPREHGLKLHIPGSINEALIKAVMNQAFVGQAPVALVCTANYARTTDRYGERGIMYVHMEAGHIGQNVHLQSEAMGLGTCMIGAFSDDAVSKLLKLDKNQKPLYIMPVGKPSS